MLCPGPGQAVTLETCSGRQRWVEGRQQQQLHWKMDTEVGNGRSYGFRRQGLLQNNPMKPWCPFSESGYGPRSLHSWSSWIPPPCASAPLAQRLDPTPRQEITGCTNSPIPFHTVVLCYQSYSFPSNSVPTWSNALKIPFPPRERQAGINPDSCADHPSTCVSPFPRQEGEQYIAPLWLWTQPGLCGAGRLSAVSSSLQRHLCQQ